MVVFHTSPNAPRPITFRISKSSLRRRICFTLEVKGLAVERWDVIRWASIRNVQHHSMGGDAVLITIRTSCIRDNKSYISSWNSNHQMQKITRSENYNWHGISERVTCQTAEGIVQESTRPQQVPVQQQKSGARYTERRRFPLSDERNLRGAILWALQQPTFWTWAPLKDISHPN